MHIMNIILPILLVLVLFRTLLARPFVAASAVCITITLAGPEVSEAKRGNATTHAERCWSAAAHMCGLPAFDSKQLHSISATDLTPPPQTCLCRSTLGSAYVHSRCTCATWQLLQQCIHPDAHDGGERSDLSEHTACNTEALLCACERPR
eukprot:3932588-Rhodomonas_salina.1